MPAYLTKPAIRKSLKKYRALIDVSNMNELNDALIHIDANHYFANFLEADKVPGTSLRFNDFYKIMVLLSISSLIFNCNPDDPLATEIAKIYRTDRAHY